MERVYTDVLIGGRHSEVLWNDHREKYRHQSCSRFVFVNSSKIIYTDPLFEFPNNACPSR